MLTASALIIMTTYNGEQYIVNQIESIRSQTFTNWKLYISDDCSSDSTLDLLMQFTDIDSRIIVATNKGNHGAYENFYTAIENCKHQYGNTFQYYFFCDQDDIWRSDKLETEILALQEIEVIQGEDKSALCYSDMELINGDGLSIGRNLSDEIDIDLSKGPLNLFFAHTYVYGTTVAFNRPLWAITNIPETNRANISHDSWYAKHALLLGSICYIPEPLVRYRRHDNNVTNRPENYNAITALKHLFSSYKEIIEGQANTYWGSLQVLKCITDKTAVQNELVKVFENGGLYAIFFMQKHKIKVAQNRFRQLSRYLILGLSIYKRADIFNQERIS